MTKRLSKADILSRAAPKTKDISVPEWAVAKEKPPVVTIKAWSIADRDMILTALDARLKGVVSSTLAPEIVACSLIDPDTGDLMFPTNSEEDIEAVRAMSHEGLVRVMNGAYHLNGLGIFATDEEGQRLRDEAEAKAKAEQLALPAPEEDVAEAGN